MEKAFRIESNAEYYIDLEEYINMVNKQKELISIFMDKHNIKTNKYYLSGTGFMNCAFEERDKEDISFGIVPTEDDKDTFSKMLCKEKEGLCLFKKKSNILKELQDYCIENEVVINLWKPRLRDYLKSLSYYAYSSGLFKYNDCYYLNVDSEILKDDDIPKGFIEMKMSEFYKIVEESKKDR